MLRTSGFKLSKFRYEIQNSYWTAQNSFIKQSIRLVTKLIDANKCIVYNWFLNVKCQHWYQKQLLLSTFYSVKWWRVSLKNCCELILECFNFFIVYCTPPCSTVGTYNRVCRSSSQDISKRSFTIYAVYRNFSTLGINISFPERMHDIAIHVHTFWKVREPYFSILCFCCSFGALLFEGQSRAKCNWLV